MCGSALQWVVFQIHRSLSKHTNERSHSVYGIDSACACVYVCVGVSFRICSLLFVCTVCCRCVAILLQCVGRSRFVHTHTATHCNTLQHIATYKPLFVCTVCYTVLQVFCNVLRWVAVCCSVLQCVDNVRFGIYKPRFVCIVCCSMLQAYHKCDAV